MIRPLVAALLALAPAAVQAQASADPALTARAGQLVAVLAGRADDPHYFAASFREAVPPTKLDALLAQLRASLGEPLRIRAIVPEGRWAARLTVAYQRGTAQMRLAVALSPPHAVTGLLVTGTQLADDSPTRVLADLAALPGHTAIGLYRIDRTPTPVLEAGGERPMPLGSAFKLWVLDALARQVAAGRHRWDEVVPTGPASLPSGILQTWPPATPMTLQALATLMIASSDNTATDTLIGVVGHDAVDEAARRHGGGTPVLTTREAFAIKSDPALTARWRATDPRGRAALLQDVAPVLAARRLDPMMFSGDPIANDSVEWFAGPRAMAALLADLAAAGPVVRAILAVNHGADPGTVDRFAYLGFKGGSEPGVTTLTYLAQDRAGAWYALVVGWHRADGATDEAKLAGLAMRALGLIGG